MTDLREAINRLEVEAYQHGMRNGYQKADKGAIKPSVGSPHHEARAGVERLLAELQRGADLLRGYAETIAEDIDSWGDRDYRAELQEMVDDARRAADLIGGEA